MTRSIRNIVLLAFVLSLPLAVACGGGEPAGDEMAEPAQEEPAAEPVEEPSAADSEMADEVPPAEEEEETPQEPELVGNINIANANFEWGETTADEANYTWSARVSNDTTANLDITVLFSFYDSNDDVLKTETATVRLAPAESQTVSGDGTMTWDEANEIYSTAATYEYEIVS